MSFFGQFNTIQANRASGIASQVTAPGDPEATDVAFDSQAQYPAAAAELSLLEQQQKAAKTAVLMQELGLTPNDDVLEIADQGFVDKKPSFFERALDVLDAPRRIVSFGLQDVMTGNQSSPGFGDYMDVAFGSGRTEDIEQQREQFGFSQSGSDLIKLMGWDEADTGAGKFGRGLGHFAVDVLLDPLSYVTFGASGLGKKVLGEVGTAMVERTTGNALKAFNGEVAEETLTGFERLLKTRMEDLYESSKNTLLEQRQDVIQASLTPKDLETVIAKIDGDAMLEATQNLRRSVANEVITPLIGRDFGKLSADVMEELPAFAYGGARLSVPFLGKKGLENGILIPGTQGLGRSLVGDHVRKITDLVSQKTKSGAWLKQVLGDLSVRSGDVDKALLRGVATGTLEGWHYLEIRNALANAERRVNLTTVATRLNKTRTDIERGMQSLGIDQTKLNSLAWRTITDKENIANDMWESLGREVDGDISELRGLVEEHARWVKDMQTDLFAQLKKIDPSLDDKMINDYMPMTFDVQERGVLRAIANAGVVPEGGGTYAEQVVRRMLDSVGYGGRVEGTIGSTARELHREFGISPIVQMLDNSDSLLLKRNILNYTNQSDELIGAATQPRAQTGEFLSSVRLNDEIEGIIKELADKARAKGFAVPETTGRIFMEDPFQASFDYVNDLLTAIQYRELIDNLEHIGLVSKRTTQSDLQRTVAKVADIMKDPKTKARLESRQAKLAERYDQARTGRTIKKLGRRSQELKRERAEAQVARYGAPISSRDPQMITPARGTPEYNAKFGAPQEGSRRAMRGAVVYKGETFPVFWPRTGVEDVHDPTLAMNSADVDGVFASAKEAMGLGADPGAVPIQHNEAFRYIVKKLVNEGKLDIDNELRRYGKSGFNNLTIEQKAEELFNAVINGRTIDGDVKSGADDLILIERFDEAHDTLDTSVFAGNAKTPDVGGQSQELFSRLGTRGEKDPRYQFKNLDDNNKAVVAEWARAHKLRNVSEAGMFGGNPKGIDRYNVNELPDNFTGGAKYSDEVDAGALYDPKTGEFVKVPLNEMGENQPHRFLQSRYGDDFAEDFKQGKVVPMYFVHNEWDGHQLVVQIGRKKIDEGVAAKIKDEAMQYAEAQGASRVLYTYRDGTVEVAMPRASNILEEIDNMNIWQLGKQARVAIENRILMAPKNQQAEIVNQMVDTWGKEEVAYILDTTLPALEFNKNLTRMHEVLANLMESDGFRRFDPDGNVIDNGIHANPDKVQKKLLQEAQDLARKIGLDPKDFRIEKYGTIEKPDVVNPYLFATGGKTLERKQINRDIDLWFEQVVKNMSAVYTPLGIGMLKEQGDTIARWWKGMATVTRPTFHIRNFIGGLWNNQIIGVGMSDYLTVRNNAVKFRNALHNAASFEEALDSLGDPKVRRIFEHAYTSGLMDMSFARAEYRTVTDEVRGKLGKVRGLANPFDPDNFALIKGGAFLMETMEDFLRLSAFAAWIDTSSDAAAKATSHVAREMAVVAHFDYRHLTELDTKLKSFMPFFVWTRRNLPLQLQVMLERPGLATRYVHLMDAVNEAGGGANEQDQYPGSEYWTGQVAGTDIVLNEDSPFWARLMFDPKLPITDILSIDPMHPAKTFEHLTSLLGPQFTLPFELAKQGEYGDVNAPAPLNQIARQLAVLGLFEDKMTEEGDLRIPYWLRTVWNTTFPFAREVVENPMGPSDPRQAAQLGDSPDDPNAFRRIGFSLARGLGIELQTPAQTRSATYKSDQLLSRVNSNVLLTSGITPEEKDEFDQRWQRFTSGQN